MECRCFRRRRRRRRRSRRLVTGLVRPLRVPRHRRGSKGILPHGATGHEGHREIQNNEAKKDPP